MNVRLRGRATANCRISARMRVLLPATALAVTALSVLATARVPLAAQQPARVWQGTFALPTYEEGPPDPNPPFDFFRPARVNYPYTLRTNLTDHRVTRKWRALFLENEYLKCTVLPDLGGHLYSCTDKVSGEEMFYANPSIKLTQIGHRGAWAAFGVEFNFPVSHNWMTTSPVDFATTTSPDGSASAWVGNTDRVTGMRWTVELTLRPGRAALEQRTTLYNRSPFRHRFYWWTNAAVRVQDDSRVIYPMRYTASHGFRDIDTWPVDRRGTDNSVVGNHLFGPVSRFAHGSREPWMAVWHPHRETGVVHYSSPTDLPAKKIWSWGGNRNGLNWRKALSDDGSAYVEIQAGLFRNQETYAFLEPQQRVVFRETWLPIRGLGGVSEAARDAVVYLGRGPGDTVRVALNVAESHAGARVTLRAGKAVLLADTLSLEPAVTYRSTMRAPAGEPVTVEVVDAGGRTLLRHTAGVYDLVPDDRIQVGPVTPSTSPDDTAAWSDGDFFRSGDDQERNGRLLEALATYVRGLARFPGSVSLHRAYGRLAVTLKRPREAAPHLEAVLAAVSDDAEAWYYLGHARLAAGDTAAARLAWEQAQQFGTFRPAALLRLAGLAAARGDRARALDLLAAGLADAPGAVRLGILRVALLRAEGRHAEARRELERWRRVDPTSTYLRVESARITGEDDPSLWAHLAADPERILDVVEDDLLLGLDEDALALLSRTYPRGEGVVTEPGMPHPSEYPLLAYYLGYVLERLGRDPSAAYAEASARPTKYVFPDRLRTGSVLRHALEHNPDDATVHFLLGEWLLSGGRAPEALHEWERARTLNPDIPTLHRDMGWAVLYQGGPDAAARAATLFSEGTRHDPANADLYFGRDRALELLGADAGERADSLLRYPDAAGMPARLVYRTAETLAAAHRFDEAEALFRNRFFPSKEGGTDVREVWLSVRLSRAEALAGTGRCREVTKILDHLSWAVPGMDFTQEGLDALLRKGPPAERLAAAWAACPLGSVDGIPYRVGVWDPDTLGNHRAVVEVGENGGDAVRVRIPWRRRDTHPEARRLRVVDAATGDAVANVARVSVTRAEGRLAFEPVSGAGTYYVYYLPHNDTGRSNYPTTTYPPPVATADNAWLTRHGLGTTDNPPPTAGAAWDALPPAQVRAFESVDLLDTFHPTEVIATEGETEALRAGHPDAPFLIFPEDRTRSIRMRADLPAKWARDGDAHTLDGDTQQGEFYAFQVGVWARTDLADVRADVSDFVRTGGEERIPGARVSRFNLQGVDSKGNDFVKRVDVPAGQVQPLWFGVPVPEDAEPGVYEARVSVSARGRPSREAVIRIRVHEGVIPAHGDDDPWRLSRLRWLDSRIALDETVTEPFTPVEVTDDDPVVLGVLGRRVELDASGFPSRIRSYFTPEMTSVSDEPRDVISAPVELVVEDSAGRQMEWRRRPPQVVHRAPGVARWEARAEAGDVTLAVDGSLEFDGTMEFQVTLGAIRDTRLSDVRLEIPVALDVARYMMGMGYKGGVRPHTFDWTWKVEHNQDGAWIGDVNAGLQFLLRDDRYVRPLNTNFYLSKPLVMPRSWANDGKGSCHMEEAPERGAGGAFLVRCSSGGRSMAAGETLRYDVRLTVTPFKPLDTDAQWTTRYYHRFESLDSIQSTGANTVNVHHATPINPWINYPFLTPDVMKAYVDEAHRRDMRVKLYYTVRELTNRAPELFALFSLGDEVLASGPGGGYSWLREHLNGDYIAGWFVPPLRDAAVINSGVSRWHNFYLEGLDWLVRNIGIDGLYIDDVAFDRVTMMRVRKILDRDGTHRLIDLHSANQFNVRDGYANSANLYLEHFPFIDRLWFGEYFDYDSKPDFWLTEISGIPFGLMGEMLQDGGNPWRGMVYGMTARLPWAGDPTPLWKAWDDFGIVGSRMVGYWVPDRPVRTGRDDVLATTYVKDGKAMVALASWAEDPVDVRLEIDWQRLGIDPASARITAPAIRDFQDAATFAVGEAIPVAPGRGWVLILEPAPTPLLLRAAGNRRGRRPVGSE